MDYIILNLINQYIYELDINQLNQISISIENATFGWTNVFPNLKKYKF